MNHNGLCRLFLPLTSLAFNWRGFENVAAFSVVDIDMAGLAGVTTYAAAEVVMTFLFSCWIFLDSLRPLRAA